MATRKQQDKKQEQEYQLKPKKQEKFKPAEAKKVIQEHLHSELQNITFASISGAGGNQGSSQLSDKTQQICEKIKFGLQEMKLPRYKYLINLIIGEDKGQGVRVGARQFFDLDTDYQVSEYYKKEDLFCLCTVYAIYIY